MTDTIVRERYRRGRGSIMTTPRPVGELLRRWRERRRLSQLEFAVQAEISTRHLSFVETGRSAPSRDMILHLSERLDLPLRERNLLLLAAGFAPVYTESSFDSPTMEPVRVAVRQILVGHEPYPAVAVDLLWNLVDANASIALFTAGVPPELLKPPVNVLRATLHPDGVARRIVNLGQWRAHLLSRLRRQVEVTADVNLTMLYKELRSFPGGESEGDPVGDSVAVPLRIRHDGKELAFISTVSIFGTPLDVTVSELAIESFFPADAQTAALLRG